MRGDIFGIYKRQLLPFAKDKENLTQVFDALEHIIYSDLGGEALMQEMPWSEHFKYLEDPLQPLRMLKESGSYPWEELALLAETIALYSQPSEDWHGQSIAEKIQQHVHDYCNRAELSFSSASKTSSGELHSVLFLKNLGLDKLELLLPRETLESLKACILNDFKIHEPYLDRVSVQKYLQPEVANMLIFGTTFFERERVGSSIRATPSEAQLKAFCKELMPSDDYEQIVENELHPPSPVDLMRALRPEAIVELFERNGVWSNYSDEQIEKMLPEGIAMIDILDARDGA